MGSTRLPSKVLKPIAGKALLDHVLGRLSRLACHAKVVVATSDKPLDDTIVQHCLKRNVALFRGSETDVLDRYFQCARENGFEHVVRKAKRASPNCAQMCWHCPHILWMAK